MTTPDPKKLITGGDHVRDPHATGALHDCGPDPIDPEFRKHLDEFMTDNDELLRRLNDDPIQAAIEAMLEEMEWTPNFQIQAELEGAFRIAAAPILIQHGRELAAEDIARHGAPTYGASSAQWDRDMRLAEHGPDRIARGEEQK